MKDAKLGDTIKHSPSGFQGKVTAVTNLGNTPTEITLESAKGEARKFKLDGLELIEAPSK